MKTDFYALAILEILLLALFSLSILMLFVAWFKKQNGAAELNATRGETSMNGLFTAYGISTVACTISIDVSSGCVDGNKSTIVLANYAMLTYLFFFSAWFRNSVLFPILNRIKND
ncbi:hypothetical protein GCM10010975_03520 [Comamonas phosphati]|nr:hypothetical protein GCM10010975_03520 [Comamonas phosphati]